MSMGFDVELGFLLEIYAYIISEVEACLLSCQFCRVTMYSNVCSGLDNGYMYPVKGMATISN